MTEQLRDGATGYTPAKCSLPGLKGPCGADLHLIQTLSTPILLASTTDDLADIKGAWSETWRVECEAGHTVLVPPDSCEDSYLFGGCRCDPEDGPVPDPEADECCGHGDMARLRAVVLAESAAPAEAET